MHCLSQIDMASLLNIVAFVYSFRVMRPQYNLGTVMARPFGHGARDGNHHEYTEHGCMNQHSKPW